MKFEIHHENSGPTVKPVRLKLIQRASGDVVVVAVDDCGRQKPSGSLIHFRRDGKIMRLSYIAKNLGFDLDAHGRIKFMDEEGYDENAC